MKIERKNTLNISQFINSYLILNKPLIVTDGMKNWPALKNWSPEYFSQNFSDYEVQMYDDLFNFRGIISLSEYIKTYFKVEDPHISAPYVRAYCKFKNMDFLWADNLFEELKNDWSLPYFLPTDQYLLPNTENLLFKPNEQAAPAKGLFISAKKCQTSLHKDPWHSDAVLCQIYGEKKVLLYSPSKEACLLKDKQQDYLPDYEDILKPGEILFIPHDWPHQVETLTDSISLTWNFVHSSNSELFKKYLKGNLSSTDLSIMEFFNYF